MTNRLDAPESEREITGWPERKSRTMLHINLHLCTGQEQSTTDSPHSKYRQLIWHMPEPDSVQALQWKDGSLISGFNG